MTSFAPWRSHLLEQLSKVLEETAFMLVEEPEAALPDSTPSIEASLSFSGEHTGICYLVVAESDALALATEMLGADESVSSSSTACDNAVAELLNILTAWLLDSWWGEEVPHSLGIPETRRVPMSQTCPWSLPSSDRVVVATDAGATFLSGIALKDK